MPEAEVIEEKPKKTVTRKDLHIPRRLFHMTNGFILVMLYQYYMTKLDLVVFLGIVASLVFIGEQVRLKYPEYAEFFGRVNQFLYRAEEQFEIASAMPYAASCLLVIFVCPKPVAIVTILFLAIGDPMSAIFGIKYGKHKIRKNRSWEGTAAFFVTCFLVSLFVMHHFYGPSWKLGVFALLGALCGATSDLVVTRLDDNITIPIISGPLLLLLWWLLFSPE